MNFSGFKRIVSFLCLGESNTAITMLFYKLINSNNFLLFSKTISDHTINSTKLSSKSFAKLIVNVRQVPACSVSSPGQRSERVESGDLPTLLDWDFTEIFLILDSNSWYLTGAV